MEKTTLAQIVKLVDETLYNANCERNFTIEINNRLTRALGRVRSFNNIPIAMEISGKLVESCKNEQVFEVVLHECAHAIANIRDPYTKHGHDEFFRQICLEIGCSLDEPSVHFDEYQSNVKQYRVYCKSCGTLVAVRQRMTNGLKEMLSPDNNSWYCTVCKHKQFELR